MVFVISSDLLDWCKFYVFVIFLVFFIFNNKRGGELIHNTALTSPTYWSAELGRGERKAVAWWGGKE